MTDGGEGDRTLSAGPARGARPEPARARLSIVYPVDLTGIIRLSGELATLGRHARGDLALRHATVSRAHLEIGWDADISRYVVRDLGSHNGSSVDGVRLGSARHVVGHGAVLRLGDVLCVFELHPETEDAGEVERSVIPGDAVATCALRARVARAAPDPSPALLVGETGTGKERIAAEVHRLSGRSGPLIAVNCAALSPNLVESQLLGHVRGAFTGAQGEQAGLIRSASGGTIFFDEIGELPLELQPKLLRVVQEREIMPVGGTRATRIDVRMVAASNRDLARLVEAGSFRRDLYARLAMWEIRVPPLRERRADILSWFRRLHDRYRQERGLPEAPLTVAADAAERLLLADWRDNLRGIDRLVHELPPGETLTAALLPAWLTEEKREAAPAPPAPRPPIPNRDELAEVLERLGGSVRATARHFNRDRRQIYRWLEAYGLRARDEE